MPLRSSIRIALAGLLALPATSGMTAAAPANVVAQCPARIDTQQSATASGGWSVERNRAAAKPLAEIAFFDGAIGDRVQLAPSSDANGRSTWTFAAGSPVTIACLYRNTDVALARALPAGTRQCTVSSGPRASAPQPMVLACR